MLRHFTRSSSYEAIAAVTGVPVGTVRSRLHRARTLLATALQREAGRLAPLVRRRRAEQARRVGGLLRRTARDAAAAHLPDMYAPDVEVTDRNGRWQRRPRIGRTTSVRRSCSAFGHASSISSRARDITVLEIDFTNPDWASDHCPPRSTSCTGLQPADRSDSTSTTSESRPVRTAAGGPPALERQRPQSPIGGTATVALWFA